MAGRHAFDDRGVDLVARDVQDHDHGKRTCVERAAWAVREAFFQDARDISSRAVLLEIAEDLGLNVADIVTAMEDGSAMAGLFRDIDYPDYPFVSENARGGRMER